MIFVCCQLPSLVILGLQKLKPLSALGNLASDVVRQASGHARNKAEWNVHHVHTATSVLGAAQSPVHELVRLHIVWGWPNGHGWQVLHGDICPGQVGCFRGAILPTEAIIERVAVDITIIDRF